MENKLTIAQLQKLVQTFCTARDWDQFHNPKDLAIGLSTESNELLDIFRFKAPGDIEAIMDGPRRADVADELADVLFFLLRFAQMYGFDLEECLQAKLQKNAEKYPIERARGCNLKSTEYNLIGNDTSG